ncbi:hypothetical protein OG206_22235 [Streptomyces sp. NBC_01341]|uniref:hypothetical protein n=1 Tax=Streptomyces sp. NBC_01341 TaxID=2903831 RepID=UPI002E1055BA|nr:hypothetical protein OG206_22235 [Streptomyces sp. NBC_01341]
MIEIAWAALGMVLEVVLFLVSLFLVLALPGIVVWGISETVDPRDVLRIRWFLQRLLSLAELVGRALLATGEWVYSHTLGRVVTSYVRWSRRRVAEHLAWVRRPFGPDAYRLFPVGRHVRAALRSWHQIAPLAAVAYLVKAFFLLQILLNLGGIVNFVIRWSSHVWAESEKAPVVWWAPGGGLWGPARQVDWTGEQPDIDVTVVTIFRAFGESIWRKAAQYLPALGAPEGRPAEAATAVFGFVLAAALLLALRAVLGLLGQHGPTRADSRRGPGFAAPPPRGWWLRSLLSLHPGAARRTRPVAVLIDCVGRAGAARRHYYQTVMQPHSAVYVPRVDLSKVEQVVWSAWKVRHRQVPGPRRREYRKHAADVVGAVRRLETRQDIDADTGQVFEEMTRMLVTITERYAQGRILALLDPKDLKDVDPAVNREWVRLVILGVVMTGAAIAAGLSKLSAAGSTQIIAVVGAVTWALLYRDRLAPGDVLDVMRGQSRK